MPHECGLANASGHSRVYPGVSKGGLILVLFQSYGVYAGPFYGTFRSIQVLEEYSERGAA